MKRLFPKKFSASSVSVPRIDHNKAAAYNLQRSKATIGPRSDASHKPNNSFTQPVPATKSLSRKDHDLVDGKTGKPGVMVRSERGHTVDKKHELIKMEGKNILELFRVWQGDRHQGVSLFLRTDVEKIGDNFCLYLLFTGNEYLFIQEYKTTRMISRIYHGRSSAEYYKKHQEEISWRITETIK